MSTKDPTDGMDDNTRQIFDAKTDKCAHGVHNLSDEMKSGCADHQAILNTMERQKLLFEETNLLNDWINRWQTQTAAMLASFVNASYAYDTILQAKAQLPLDYDVLLELGIVMLPELKAITGVYKRVVDSPTRMETSFAQLLKELSIKEVQSPGSPHAWQPVAELFDRRSKDFTTVGRAFVKSRQTSPLDTASQHLKNAYQAKNSLFDEIINNGMANLLAATAVVPELNKKVLNSVLSVADLQALIDKTGIGNPDPILTADQYSLFSDVILYRMLKEYMQTYGDILDTTTSDMTWKRDDITAGGMDKAGLDMIFARFNSSVWKGDGNFPPINNLEEMVSKWQLKMAHKEKVQFTTK